LADLGNLALEQGDYSAADAMYAESLTLFQELRHKRGLARILESFAALAAAGSDPGKALKLAGVAAALRQTIGAPLTAAEQKKLEQSVEPARRGLSTAAERAAWLEGWVMPVDLAIQQLLRSGT
jgi:hypothetical protein